MVPGRSSPTSPARTSAHRALDDIRESIEELRFYREQLFVPGRAAPSAEPDAPEPDAPASDLTAG